VHLAAGIPEAFEGLRAGHFMDEMAIDVDKAGAVILTVDQMVFPDLIEQRLRHVPSLVRFDRLKSTAAYICRYPFPANGRLG
jgi:hypothetical protein